MFKMGHTKSSEGVGVPSLDKSSELTTVLNNNQFNKNLLISNTSQASTSKSRVNSLAIQSSFGSTEPSFSSGKSTNFIPDQPFLCRTPSSYTSATSLNDDCSSNSSYQAHTRSHSENYYDKRNHRSFSLPTTFKNSRRESSYLSHCSLYSESRDEPLKWKKKLDANRRRSSSSIQQTSSLIVEPNNISYSYKEAMNIICGDKIYLSKTYQESESSFQRSDDDFCNSTPSTSVTALSSVNDEIAEELLSLDPKTLFGSENFYSLSETHVLYLIKNDDVGGHTEIEIWKNLIEWGKKNTPKIIFDNDINKWSKKDFESLARTLRNCIYWIRFSQMTPIEFQNFVMPYQYIIPKYIIGNFLRQKITDHPQISLTLAPPRIPMTPIDSTIITGRHATILSNWIKNESNESIIGQHRFNLLYRASQNGGTSKDFHLHCDNQGPTILIIKLSGHAKFIGGYNAMNYKDSKRASSLSLTKRNSIKKKEELAQKNCFIFSLQDSYYPEQTSLISRILPEFKKDAIIKHKWGGPCFGRGDLWVCPDKKNKSLNIRPTSYEIPIINPENNKGFRWEDFEVFQVVSQ
ncbi:29442_t:CDS:2 [Gigaspora margarita]|uniref:29442_t:CDS:1 n=1 Tax=Gigaspora margarita TaxID=4874 RepID=A0ABN7UJM6_GIGMA|nr:29442_t:CDS:2 [Gigaspora margarita]